MDSGTGQSSVFKDTRNEESRLKPLDHYHHVGGNVPGPKPIRPEMVAKGKRIANMDSAQIAEYISALFWDIDLAGDAISAVMKCNSSWSYHNHNKQVNERRRREQDEQRKMLAQGLSSSYLGLYGLDDNGRFVRRDSNTLRAAAASVSCAGD